ncbi:MAG: ABC transporter permease subunit [Eubacteriales bacterium]|nr:ABC transporter permease subunit [Eubacteriales bacterium]
MKQFLVFTKKEFLELFRTGKATVLLIVFSIFGILNPALAKLTPWMLNLMSETLSDQGVTIGEIAVNALTAWTQYFKNLFMEYLLVLALFSGIFAAEYQSGTLVNILTKGLPRWKAVMSKWLSVFASWSVCYWLTFGITAGYSAYFWDNAAVSHLGFGAFCAYLLGVWLLSLELTFASRFQSGMYALICTGAVYAAVFALGFLPACSAWLPARLNDAFSLLTGDLLPSDFIRSLLITTVLSIANVFLSVAGFQRKQL